MPPPAMGPGADIEGCTRAGAAAGAATISADGAASLAAVARLAPLLFLASRVVGAGVAVVGVVGAAMSPVEGAVSSSSPAAVAPPAP